MVTVKRIVCKQHVTKIFSKVKKKCYHFFFLFVVFYHEFFLAWMDKVSKSPSNSDLDSFTRAHMQMTWCSTSDFFKK